MRVASATLLFLLFFGTTIVIAQAEQVDLTTSPAGLKWGPAPPTLPTGAQITVLSGDPSKNAPYVIRLEILAGYQIPAHHHPTVENVTVLSGSFHAGMGDKLDQKNAATFELGGFVSMPANMNHYAWATSETIVQVHGEGPFQVVYVNPADDPSKK